MKISAAPSPIELVPATGSGGARTTDYGSEFDSAVREAEKELAPAPKHRKDFAPNSASPVERIGAKSEPLQQRKDVKADRDLQEPEIGDEPAARNAIEDEAAKDAPDASATQDILGRLLAAPGAAPHGAGPAGRSVTQARAPAAATIPVPPVSSPARQADESMSVFEGDGAAMPDEVLQERLIIAPIGAGRGEPLPAEAAPGKARGKVCLEVLHMETHFEPRTDDFVLVEGRAPSSEPAPTAPKAVADAGMPGAKDGTAAPEPRMAPAVAPAPAVSAETSVSPAVARDAGMPAPKAATSMPEPRIAPAVAPAPAASAETSVPPAVARDAGMPVDKVGTAAPEPRIAPAAAPAPAASAETSVPPAVARDAGMPAAKAATSMPEPRIAPAVAPAPAASAETFVAPAAADAPLQRSADATLPGTRAAVPAAPAASGPGGSARARGFEAAVDAAPSAAASLAPAADDAAPGGAGSRMAATPAEPATAGSEADLGSAPANRRAIANAPVAADAVAKADATRAASIDRPASGAEVVPSQPAARPTAAAVSTPVGSPAATSAAQPADARSAAFDLRAAASVTPAAPAADVAPVVDAAPAVDATPAPAGDRPAAAAARMNDAPAQAPRPTVAATPRSASPATATRPSEAPSALFVPRGADHPAASLPDAAQAAPPVAAASAKAAVPPAEATTAALAPRVASPGASMPALLAAVTAADAEPTPAPMVQPRASSAEPALPKPIQGGAAIDLPMPRQGAAVTVPAVAASASDARLRPLEEAVAAFLNPAPAKSTASSSRIDGDDETQRIPIRFDEALARLSTRQASGQQADAEPRYGERGASTTNGSDRQRAGAGPASREDGARFAVARPKAEAAPKPAASLDSTVVVPSAANGAMASMTGQVAGRVIDALRPSAADARPADLPPGETHLRLTAGGAALKTLTIQLQPENLGRIEVSMRLVEGQLTLELAATEHETALVLGQDRDGLKKLLEHAGFSMDNASITIVTRDASVAPVRAAAGADAGQSAFQDNASQGSAGQAFEDRRDQSQPGRQRHPGSGSGGDAPTDGRPARQRSSTVFL